MQTKQNIKRLPFILCIVMIGVMALFTTGCNGSKDKGTPDAGGKSAETLAGSKAKDSPIQIGEGSTVFPFNVIDQDGNETQFEVRTDKEIVGEALLELGMIDGDEGEYGLYVKTVNGITVDYDTDGVYWAFYVNDEYAPTGVDSTTITEGNSYSFRIE